MLVHKLNTPIIKWDPINTNTINIDSICGIMSVTITLTKYNWLDNKCKNTPYINN